MAKEIYNEGRVVGYSAYEIYLKNHISRFPSISPASERQWLSANIGSGESILIKVPESAFIQTIAYDTTGANYSPTPNIYAYRINIPLTSKLAAANTIVASFFAGEALFATNENYATRVTDYGAFIDNKVNYPDPQGTQAVFASSDILPQVNTSTYNYEGRLKLSDYLKIIDGGVVQAGAWINTRNPNEPKKDFIPAFDVWGSTTSVSIVILTDGPITHTPYILLTGFQQEFVVSGTSGVDGSTSTTAPQDGDFLGPAVIPWANKIIFTMPTEGKNLNIDYMRRSPLLTYENYLGDVEYSEDGPITNGGRQRIRMSGQTIEFEDMGAACIIHAPNGYWRFYNGKWNAISDMSASFQNPTYKKSTPVLDFTVGKTNFYDGLSYGLAHDTERWMSNFKNQYKIEPKRKGFMSSDVNHDDTSILSVYSIRDTTVPSSVGPEIYEHIDIPTLYYSELDQDTQTMYLNPVDVGAPGTVKLFYYEKPEDGDTAFTADNRLSAIRAVNRQERLHPGTVGLAGFENNDSMLLCVTTQLDKLVTIANTEIETIPYEPNTPEDHELPGVQVSNVTRNTRFLRGYPEIACKQARINGGGNRVTAISLVNEVGTTFDDIDKDHYSHPYVEHYKLANRDSVMCDDKIVLESPVVGPIGFDGTDYTTWPQTRQEFNHYLGVTTSPIVSQCTLSTIIVNGVQVDANLGDYAKVTQSADLNTPANLFKTYVYEYNESRGRKEWTDMGYNAIYVDTHNSVEVDSITWSKLFDALVTDASIDILGDSLKRFKYNLGNLFTYNMSSLSTRLSDTIYLKNRPFRFTTEDIPYFDKDTADNQVFGTGIHLGNKTGVTGPGGYISINGLRLYIVSDSSDNFPLDAPEGSIGLLCNNGSGNKLWHKRGSQWLAVV